MEAPLSFLPRTRHRLAAEHQVNLSTEPMVLMGDRSTRLQYLTASLGQPGDDGALQLVIGRNDSVGVAATRDEARRFALGILALLDERDG